MKKKKKSGGGQGIGTGHLRECVVRGGRGGGGGEEGKS